MQQNPYLKECLRGGWTELSQEGNWNANARLFRKEKTVRKLYIADASENIRVLKSLMARTDLDAVPELVLPTKLLLYEGQTAGFEMPWAEGVFLDEALEDLPFAGKMSLFRQIADAIRHFPEGLIWGDVHGRNILCAENGIRIVDPDGLGLSCPQQMRADRYHPKYCEKDGQLRISRDTDILGLCELALNTILDGRSFYAFPSHWQDKFIEFIKQAGAIKLAEMIRSTCEDGPCLLFPEAFEGPWTGKDISYDRFLQVSGLWKEEQASEELLNQLIKERNKENGRQDLP